MNIDNLRAAMSVPAIVAPMLLVSGPDLVIAACRSGVIGSFPAANARTADECEAWLSRIVHELEDARRLDPDRTISPYAVNIIVRGAGSDRYQADLELAKRFAVPIVITSVGDPSGAVKRIHDYGGIVFHDVATIRHARKAIAAGVDGLILLTAGAGGHTGTANPFAFVSEVRRIFDGIVIVAGGISDGAGIAAVQTLGGDFAYMGTRFAATRESLASDAYKDLLVSQEMTDVIVTDRVSGLSATFMRGSLAAVGLDADNLPPRLAPFEPNLPPDLKAWRDIWSAGQGVGLIDDVPSTSELVARLRSEFMDASSRMAGMADQWADASCVIAR